VAIAAAIAFAGGFVAACRTPRSVAVTIVNESGKPVSEPRYLESGYRFRATIGISAIAMDGGLPAY
jgi:hypothetical protein